MANKLIALFVIFGGFLTIGFAIQKHFEKLTGLTDRTAYLWYMGMICFLGFTVLSTLIFM